MTDSHTQTDQRELAWARFPNDALVMDHDVPERRCSSRKCRAPVWHGFTRSGKPTVFDIKPNGERTGTNHWRTCLDRERFKR
jgi:hypothetical protein